MSIHFVRRGQGKKLLLIHGLGSSRATWSQVLPALAGRRDVIALDLPGHGASPAESDSDTFAGLMRSVEDWLAGEGLEGIDVAGSSLGGRMALELARRGLSGASVALDPGGFWEGWERNYVQASLAASVAVLRLLSPALPMVAHSAAARTPLLAQLSARPWALDGDLTQAELTSFAATPTFDALLSDLAFGPLQEGPAAAPSGPVTIGWGRHDRLCFPAQAERAHAAFPGSRLAWFDHSAHYPQWDEPEETAKLLLEATD